MNPPQPLDSWRSTLRHRPTGALTGRRAWRWAGPVVAALLCLAATGCAVPQPRGHGRLQRVVEPTTRRPYWLYLPQEYVEADEATRAGRRWPLVFTFHGMKPFDGSRAQAREWEQEADRYGFIVVAPVLSAPSVFKQFPVRKVGRSFKSDEEATLAILDHVITTTHGDPANVLSTSWSSGGYLAHYMLNQHPDHFTCLAVRQSNFSVSILDSQQVARSRHHPLLLLTTQNDFGGVKRECREAIKWYETHEYANFAWLEIKSLGHERTPDMAAAFFARVAGVEPNKPPLVLARRQAVGGNPRGLALLSGAAESLQPRPAESRGAPPGTVAARPTPPRSTASGARPPASGRPVSVRRPSRSAVALRTPATSPRKEARPRSPVSIRVSSAIGTEPFLLSFSADCPADWRASADFLWTLNGDPVCSGVNGQKTITEPGEHTLGLLVVTGSGQEHRAYRLVRVLPHIESRRRPADAGS